MARATDRVIIGEVYKINSINYRAVGRCAPSAPGEEPKILLIGVVATFGIRDSQRARANARMKLKGRSHPPPPHLKASSITRMKLKLTEKEVLEKVAETSEDSLGSLRLNQGSCACVGRLGSFA